MKIIQKSLLLSASLLVINTTFCPTTSESNSLSNIPKDVSIAQQNIVGAGLGIGLSCIAPGSNSLWTVGIGALSYVGAAWCRVKGNSYYKSVASTLRDSHNQEETQREGISKNANETIKKGTWLHYAGYLASGVAYCCGIKYVLNAPGIKENIKGFDISASRVFNPISLGRLDSVACQKYHVGSSIGLVGGAGVLGVMGDKAANTQMGQELSKKVKKMLWFDLD